MKKIVFFLLFVSVLSSYHAQTNDLVKASDYYKSYIKEGKVSDLEKAYEHISLVMLNEKNRSLAEPNFQYGIIAKQYLETKQPKEKSEFIYSAANALLKTYIINKNFDKKEQLLKMMQIMGYDLYNDGIRLYNDKNTDKAYQSYQLLLKIQSVLAENKMDFTIATKSGEKMSLTSGDILNNFVVFCLNSNKKEEAKAVFESEIKINPTAINYGRLIQLCNQVQDSISAQKYIQEGLTRFPNDEDLLIFSINYHLERAHYEQALAQIGHAIQVVPTPKLFLVQSQILESSTQYNQAIDSYMKGLKMYPEDFDLNYSLGYALFNNALRELNKQDEKTKPTAMNMIKDAKMFFLKAKSIDPTKADFDKIISNVDSIH